jgi:hypothetical protein
MRFEEGYEVLPLRSRLRLALKLADRIEVISGL